jgi:hypothetical protein
MMNEERDDRLREFWPTMQPLSFLALEWGVSEARVSQLAKKLGLPTRKHRLRRLEHVSMSANPRAYFERHAERRSMTVSVLKRALLDTIANDRLIDAILDDADEKAAPISERSLSLG